MDLCKNCLVRGNYNRCLKTSCQHHDSWIFKKNMKEIKALKEYIIGIFEFIELNLINRR